MRPRSRRRSVHFPWLAAIALAALGCGHPATVDECNELYAKSAEVELRGGQKITDPAVIAERTAAAKATPRGAEFANKCVGKRITSEALACVRKASTAEQMDRCL